MCVTTASAGSSCLLVLLTLGLAMAQEEVKDPNLFRQDFRGAKVDHRFLQFVPSEADVKVERGGLRIQLPLVAGRPQSAGVETRFRVKGDCQITASYELVQVEKPTEGYGAGVSLRLTTDTENMTTAMIECVERTNGLHYICQKVTRKEGEKAQRQMRFFATWEKTGKLRLVRQGAVVSFLVATKDSDEFTQLHQLEVGLEDLVSIRVAAESHGSNVPVTIRVHDLEIRATDVLTNALLQIQPQETSWAEWMGLGKYWPLAAAIFPVLFALLAGIWLWRRYRRTRRVPAQPPRPGE